MIYFVLSPETNTIKIGYAASNIKGRLANLQTGNPVYLTLIQVIEGDLETEKQLHEEFAEYRQQGEWFYFGERLRRYITNLNMQTVTVETSNKKPTNNKTANKLLNVFNDECYKDKIKYDLTSGTYFYKKDDKFVKFDFDKSRKYILENYNDLPTVNQLKNVLPIIAEKIYVKKQNEEITEDKLLVELAYELFTKDNYVTPRQILLNFGIKKNQLKQYDQRLAKLLREEGFTKFIKKQNGIRFTCYRK